MRAAPKAKEHKATVTKYELLSHVKVLGKRPAPGDNLNDVVYALRHIEIFKNPQNCMSPAVFNSSESSVCGLQLEVGKPYLLSGPCDRSADGGKLSRSQDGSMVARKEAALKNLQSRPVWPPHKELKTETRWQCGTSTNAGAAPRRKNTERLS
ncbi:unnamed protein product [Nippostrongylus brasiliensis]|uniref:Integrase_SAM-like_N domain-containing protein n=1 Tax=Nippostrongylus brasiliensis TaxID=27835 RepID=A0A0N4Y7C4_NIPBR|nr:unnamed protein product [Nippostrongylus brasiliensis]